MSYFTQDLFVCPHSPLKTEKTTNIEAKNMKGFQWTEFLSQEVPVVRPTCKWTKVDYCCVSQTVYSPINIHTSFSTLVDQFLKAQLAVSLWLCPHGLVFLCSLLGERVVSLPRLKIEYVLSHFNI